MTESAFAAPPLSTSLRRFALSVGSIRLDIADLILLGIITGEWLEFERTAGWGVKLEREHSGTVTEAQLDQQLTDFRYERSLVSAMDFQGWLDARSLRLSDVRGVIGRRILRNRKPSAAPPSPSGSIEQGDLAPVLRAEAFCDGILARLADAAIARLGAARRLSGPGGGRARGAPEIHDDARVEATLPLALPRHAAGLAALDEQTLRTRLARLFRLDDAHQALRAELDEPAAVNRRCREHALDWLRVSGDELVLPSEGAAREGRMMIEEGSATVAEVGDLVGAVSCRCSFFLSDADPRMAGMLASAPVGAVVGPWQRGEQWHLMVLHSKEAPSAENRLLHKRAVDELLDEAVEREVLGKTRRHDAL